jgi:RND family efflux transporter MFP subunit
VSPSPEVRLAADQARAALESQRTVTDDTRQRFAMGLATRDDQARQEQALASAQSQVDKYSQWLEQDRLLAPASGLVRDVLTSEGALVPAGGPLVSIALQQRFEVRLGVEPEDIVTLHTGQTVRLQPVDRSGGAPVVGRIRSIGQQVSAETRLVEVMVAPPEGTQRLLLNQFVRAEVEVRDTRGLIVPRSAVLPHEDGFLLFTVKEGRATRHEVELGISTDRLVQVQGDGLADGDSVVVLGNYELTDGMGVRVIDSRPEGNPR